MKRRRSKGAGASSSTSVTKFLPEVVKPKVGEIATLSPGSNSVQPEINVFCCHLCGKEFHSPQAMGGHMNSHPIERTEVKKREKKMAVHLAQMELKAMDDAARRIGINVKNAERKAWEDATKRIAIFVENAERKAMEEAERIAAAFRQRAEREAMEEAERNVAIFKQKAAIQAMEEAERNIAVLKQRAEMRAMEELKAAFKQQMMMHYFGGHPRIYSPNHTSLSGSGSSSDNTFYIFLESKTAEEFQNGKKSRHDEPFSNRYDHFQLRPGDAFDPDLDVNLNLNL